MTKKIIYTHEEILNAYYTWVQAFGRPRQVEWCEYTDRRDGLPSGESYKRYLNITRPDRATIEALEVANKIAREAFINNLTKQ